jgi:MFS family permease
MAGVLITSILSGQLISRFGRYRMFPIGGTALMVVAMILLSRLQVGTPAWVASAYAMVLGLGLGMTMQVLILAVQNAVEPRVMGVATSGSTTFRQVGGSIGVSVFGAIFANQLHGQLALHLPKNVQVPKTTSPRAIGHLPPAAHAAYEHAFAAALHPVFITAAVVSVLAFLFAWLLHDLPLRGEERTAAAAPAAV